ncbi:hypothetical protein WR25_10670 [Diploscapter pachys]|uniref:Uncharacterized protein n=1 Tax=Diploscapter pachys TaxID=2018661 RepID=A0A2A2K154_9BILA|nr:hypothetical protein WR25_10670 [Diploscapter pachys]
MAADADAPPATLADRVASPGGSTRQGLNVLDRADGLHRPIARHRLLAGRLIGLRHLDPHRLEQVAFELRPLRGQAQQPLAAVAFAGAGGDELAVAQLVEYATQRLLGDRQHRQQLADRQIGLAGDEIQGTVVRAAQSLGGKPLVDGAREMAMAEIQQFHATTEFGFTQELRGCGGHWGSHIDRFSHRPYASATPDV